LRDLFKAVVLNDGEKAGRLLVERARYEIDALILFPELLHTVSSKKLAIPPILRI